MIRKCAEADLEIIYEIINDSAEAYRGNIPADRWHDPYMTREQLKREVHEGVQFWGFEQDQAMAGVMGIQDRDDVTLIRHAYVRSKMRNRGIGSRLLRFLESTTEKPILIGTWADAVWAVAFYRKHGYRQVSTEEKNQLLRRYWKIPERQVDTSVVLAGKTWRRGWRF